MTTTPSAGAVRAAEKIAEAIFNHSLNSDGGPTYGPEQSEITTIIDKETGLADLVTVAENVADAFDLFMCDPSPKTRDVMRQGISALRAALAKHQEK